MSRQAAAILFGTVFVFAAAALGLWFASRSGPAPGEGDTTEVAAPGALEERTVLELYFPGRQGKLYAAQRPWPEAAETEELLRQVVTALLAEPVEPPLRPPFPPGVGVGDVFLSPAGVAYVDLSSAELASPPAAGSLGEMLAVYSVVNTVLLNLPEVRGVVLLWNGQQQVSFSGHLDTSRPLAARRDLVAG